MITLPLGVIVREVDRHPRVTRNVHSRWSGWWSSVKVVIAAVSVPKVPSQVPLLSASGRRSRGSSWRRRRNPDADTVSVVGWPNMRGTGVAWRSP